MYTITFYSFKGGVGRTLALVNIGVELARTGRRVLLVDFDLEAPGIDTFEELRSPDSQPGLVDFVTDYVEAGQVPDSSQYLYETPLSTSGDEDRLKGKLWAMPAGKQDGRYAARLAALDWQRLYSEQDGFLLFEELKAQWKEELAPDYILIDSRTGHTEVGGICTRQLADAVVFLFFPNRQNLEGLKQVVSAVRQENAVREANQDIDLLFVASNVPYLDDEEEILQDSLREFRRELAPITPDDMATIHRYESLHLVQQAIFVLRHPKSRLAEQYRLLLRRLARRNVEDRLGGIDYLRRHLRTADSKLAMSLHDHDHIESILKLHAQDSALCLNAALLYKKLSLYDLAIPWFEKAIANARANGEPVPPQALVACAESRLESGDTAQAKNDILEAFEDPSLPPHEIRRVVRLFHSLDQSALEDALGLPAFEQIDTLMAVRLASDLMTSRDMLKAAKTILDAHPPEAKYKLHWQAQVALVLIASGKFAEAVRMLEPQIDSCDKWEIQDAFNYAMARWGLTRQVPRDTLQKVLELDQEVSRKNDANYEQCLALVLGLLGRRDDARSRLVKSRELIEKIPVPTFSCWRYLMATKEEFRSDLDVMTRSLDTGDFNPEFMSC